MITFVIFHVSIPRGTVYTSRILPTFHRKNLQYDLLLDLAFRSTSLFHPGCKKVLLTDMKTDINLSEELSGDVQIIREEVDTNQIMYARMKAELSFIRQCEFDSPVVLMDSDMLINMNLQSIFDDDFDIALTYCDTGISENDKKMPINGGLILVNNHSKDRVIHFFEYMHEKYSSKELEEYRLWWGDQHALIEAVGRENFFNRNEDLLLAQGATIRVLPCSKYNYAPKKKAASILDELKEKVIIHFRGGRKKYMKLYWDRYLAAHESRSFQVKIRACVAGLILFGRMLFSR